MFADGVDVGRLLELLVLVDALLDENFLQRREVQLFQQLALADFQFLAYQVLCAVHRVAQHVADGEELRLVVLDDAAVGRYVDFAVREGIQRVQRLVRRHAGRQLHLYLHLGSRQVLHVACLDLALVDSFQYRVDNRLRGLRERYLADDQRLRVQLLYLGTHLQHAATLSVVVFRHVDGTSRGEVGIQVELLAVQVADGSVAQFHEVVGQDFRRQTDGNTLRTLCQQQRELHRQRDRLLVAAVV